MVVSYEVKVVAGSLLQIAPARGICRCASSCGLDALVTGCCLAACDAGAVAGRGWFGDLEAPARGKVIATCYMVIWYLHCGLN